MKKSILLFLLLLISMPALAIKAGKEGEVNGLPYITYNSTYGFYYGVIGKETNVFNANESLMLSAYIISNGGNGAFFVFSNPDDNLRQGKKFGLGLDITGDLGKTIDERYYGIGSKTKSGNYTTYNNNHYKFIFQFTRTFLHNLLGEADIFVANNKFSNIIQGEAPITKDIEKSAESYSGGALKLIIDNRDQNLNPHSGSYIIGNLEGGLGSCDYIKGSIDLRSYFNPFAPKQVFAARLQLNQALGNAMPIFEYPSLGGNNNMRGYTVNRFRDLSSMLLNFEYRFPVLIDMFQTVVFYELGQVGNKLINIDFTNCPSDIGIGFRLNLQDNVLLRADFGVGNEGLNMYYFYNQAF